MGGSLEPRVSEQCGQHRETLSLQKIQNEAGTVVHACGPSTWEAEAGGLLEPEDCRLQ